ncbi:MAG: hypothetical protein NTY36_12900 [Deltaproteobacteria bacterium]|nr:hypothetical protein [Deltaproteobacteria bacterium]
MANHGDQDKALQRTLTHYVFKMAVDQIYTLSDSLMAIHPSKYEVEKDIIASLVFLIYEKTRDIKSLMEETTREKRSLGLD